MSIHDLEPLTKKVWRVSPMFLVYRLGAIQALFSFIIFVQTTVPPSPYYNNPVFVASGVLSEIMAGIFSMLAIFTVPRKVEIHK